MTKLETKMWWYGMVAGYLLTALLNILPFSDAALYRRAIEKCEQALPRTQHCEVVGIPK